MADAKTAVRPAELAAAAQARITEAAPVDVVAPPIAAQSIRDALGIGDGAGRDTKEKANAEA